MVGLTTRSVLTTLVDRLGETANLAVLTGDHAEYVAQAPSRHAMRMFTEVGRRVELHCTGVGKALLAQLDDAQVVDIVRRVGLSAYTSYTITSEASLRTSLEQIRANGYAIDEQEQEDGVRCVAVPVTSSGLTTHMAVSVSGPTVRMTQDVVARAIPLLKEAAVQLTSGPANAAG
jgi:IclR family acetate operon transcriptional repressor